MQSVYLDTAIAVVFVFLLFSVLAYVVQEWIAGLRKSRGKMLEFAISEVFKDTVNLDYDVLIYEHPQIDLLKRTKHELPSYIPAVNFATAVIDVIGRQSNDVSYTIDEETGLLKEQETVFSTDAFVRFKRGVELLKYSELKILLNSFLQNANDYATLEVTIVDWFNEYMKRVSGWYKKGTRNNLVVISTCLVLFFNVDAIYLLQNIFSNSQLRSTLVAAAEKTISEPTVISDVLKNSTENKLALTDSLFKARINAATDSVGKINLIREWTSVSKNILDSAGYNNRNNVNSVLDEIRNYRLPIGWELRDSVANYKFDSSKGFWAPLVNKYRRIKFYFSNFATIQNNGKSPSSPDRSVWTILLGWFIAAVGISFGAPFWFDLLGKLVNIRRAGIKPVEAASTNNSKSN